MPLQFILMAIMLYASIIIGELTKPKPKNAEAANFKDFNFPTASENRPVAYFAGTIYLDSPNIVWSGDFYAEPVYKDFGPAKWVYYAMPILSLFKSMLSKHIITHYRYHYGFDLAFGFGPNVEMLGIYANKLQAWTGVATNGSTIDIGPTARELFGGEDKEGGLSALIDFYSGEDNALGNDYLVSQLGEVPGYINVSHAVWRGWHDPDGADKGYIGTSTNVKPLAFKLRRVVDVLSQPDFSQIVTDTGTVHANPIEVIYELMTSYQKALGLPTLSLNLTSFQEAAETCFNDRLGVDPYFDNQKAAGELIQEILALVDGVIVFNPQTAEYEIILCRDDYDPDDLTVYDENHIKEIQDYTRGTYDETINEIKIPFTNADDDFKQTAAIAQDPANIATQSGAVNTGVVEFIGVGDATCASRLALRELRRRTVPLARMTLMMDRVAAKFRIGTVFKLTWSDPDLTFDSLVVRVAEIAYGELQDGFVPVKVVEDIFSIGESTFFTPPVPTSGFSSGLHAAVPVDVTTGNQAEVQEQLYSGNDDAQLWTVAERPQVDQVSYDAYVDSGLGYIQRGSSFPFTPTATLNAAMDRLTADEVTSVEFTQVYGIEALSDQTTEAVAGGVNLFRINKEIFAFETLTLVGDILTLFNVRRALLDTTYEAHDIDSKAWFFSYGAGFLPDTFAAGATAHTKILPRSKNAVVELSTATAINTAIIQRALRPIAPANLDINGSVLEAASTVGADTVLTWFHRDRKKLQKAVKQSDDSFGPEAFTTYTLKIYKTSGSLIHTETGITENTFTYTNAREVIDAGSEQDWLSFVLYSEREGLTSYMAQIRQVKRVGVVSSPPTLPTYTPSGTYTPTPSQQGSYNYPSQITLNADGTVASVVAASHAIIGIEIDNGTTIIPVNTFGMRQIPFDCDIIEWSVYEYSSTPISTTTTVDIRKDVYANYPPDSADSICGAGTKPNLTAQTKNLSSTFTSWSTVRLNAGDVVFFFVTANNNAKRIEVNLKVKKV